MTEGADDKIRSAIKTLGSDPEKLESVLSVSGDARLKKLDELGLGGIKREDVKEFIEQDEVSGFAMRQISGGPKPPLPSTVEWVGVAATLAAGALAA